LKRKLLLLVLLALIAIPTIPHVRALSTVDTTTNVAGAAYFPQQREACGYQSGRHWVVYWDGGTNIKVASSADGIAWTVPSVLRSGASNAAQIGIYCDGTFLSYAFDAGSADIFYRRFTTNPDGTLTASAVEQQVTTGLLENNPLIAVDDMNHAWILASETTTSNVRMWKNVNIDGTWSTSFMNNLQTGSSVGIVPVPGGTVEILAFSSGNVGAYFCTGGCSIEGTIASNVNRGDRNSIIVHNGIVDLCYVGTSPFDMKIVERSVSGAWGSSFTIQSGTTVNNAVSCSWDPTANLYYAFYSSIPTTSHVYYRTSGNGVQWSAATDWFTESGTFANDGVLTSFPQTMGGFLGFLFESGTISPFNVRYNFLSFASVPSAPLSLTGLRSSCCSTSLNWTQPSNLGGVPRTNITYNVYRSILGGVLVKYATLVPNPNFLDQNAQAGFIYVYQVSAVNIAGESSKSNQVVIAPDELNAFLYGSTSWLAVFIFLAAAYGVTLLFRFGFPFAFAALAFISLTYLSFALGFQGTLLLLSAFLILIIGFFRMRED